MSTSSPTTATSGAPSETAPARVVTAVTSFADLQPLTITVEIERANREVWSIPARPPSYTRYVQTGLDVPEPVPPINGVDKNNRPIYDYQDRGFQRQRAEANVQRTYKRLFDFLVLDIPGDTLDAKIASFETVFSAGEVRQLQTAYNQLIEEGKAQVHGLADTFHRDGPGSPADVRAAGTDGAG